MAEFMNVLMKMSARGIVIILVVIAFRFLLKKLGTGHKYIAGLWMMVFMFFIIPWKVSLPVGFWGNTAVPGRIWGNAEKGMEGDAVNTEKTDRNDYTDNRRGSDTGSYTESAGKAAYTAEGR